MRSAIVRIDERRVEVELIDLVKFRTEALGWHFRYPQPYFSPKLKAKLAAEYKQILLDKTRRYAENGEAALDIYADQEESVSARDAFAAMAKFQATTAGHNPRFYSFLGRPPREARNTESFIYWA